jgi:hypothetical protein
MKWMYQTLPFDSGPALMRLATLVTVVRPVCPVIQPRPPIAVIPATPQRRVERVEQVPVQRPDLHRTDQWPDVFLGQAAVIGERIDFELSQRELEVPIEQLINGGVRPQVAPLVDLGSQPAHAFCASAWALRPAEMLSFK